MRRFALSVAVVIVVGACTLRAADDELVQVGKRVYADQKCGLCHKDMYPLTHVAVKLTSAQIREWVENPPEAAHKARSNASPAMPPYKNLAKWQVDALVAYLETMKPPRPPMKGRK
jgi:hypothetical protein